MTDIDRLIKLIRQARKFTKNANCDLEREGIFADHLLANGVIVPPCKVGDKVYMITPNGNIRKLVILEIYIEQSQHETKINILAVYNVNKMPHFIQIFTVDFGKNIFLTKEEAEQKLKECEGE